MKKLTMFLLTAFSACVHTDAPHNYADAYVAVVVPDAKRHVIDDSAVLVRKDLQMFVCIADASHHTSCYAMIDWTPKPTTNVPAPSPASSAQPTVAPAMGSNPAPATEAKPADKKSEK